MSSSSKQQFHSVCASFMTARAALFCATYSVGSLLVSVSSAVAKTFWDDALQERHSGGENTPGDVWKTFSKSLWTTIENVTVAVWPSRAAVSLYKTHYCSSTIDYSQINNWKNYDFWRLVYTFLCSPCTSPFSLRSCNCFNYTFPLV